MDDRLPSESEIDYLRTQLACASDYLNTWAREIGVSECRDPYTSLNLRNLVARIQTKVSTDTRYQENFDDNEPITAEWLRYMRFHPSFVAGGIYYEYHAIKLCNLRAGRWLIKIGSTWALIGQTRRSVRLLLEILQH